MVSLKSSPRLLFPFLLKADVIKNCEQTMLTLAFVPVTLTLSTFETPSISLTQDKTVTNTQFSLRMESLL